MIYLGIDPGVNGGIVAVDGSGRVIFSRKMPPSATGVIRAIADARGTLPGQLARAIVERVSASPQMGVVSAFTFGRGYERPLAILETLGIPIELVTPAEWQTELECRSAGDKNVTKRRAQTLHPTLTVTHAIADAMLLAEYGRRTDRGLLSAHTRTSPDGKNTSTTDAQRRRSHAPRPHEEESEEPARCVDAPEAQGPARGGAPRYGGRSHSWAR